MVNIIDICFGVDKLDKIADDLDNIFPGKDLYRHFSFQAKLFINPVASNLSKIISLVGEKQFVNNITGSSFIRWFCISAADGKYK